MSKHPFCAAVLVLASAAAAQPFSTAFTYQGELRDAGIPVNGTYDLRFRLFDALTGGAQVVPTLCVDNTLAVGGRLAASLDFGSQFAGQKRFLEVEVRRDAGLSCVNPAAFVILGPRQELSPAPNALFAVAAATATSATTAGSATIAVTATNATQFNGQPAAFYTNAANLNGTLPTGSLVGTYGGSLALTNPANSFSGSGASLTNVNAATLDGLDSTAFLQVAGPFLLSGSSTGAMLSGQNASSATDATRRDRHHRRHLRRTLRECQPRGVRRLRLGDRHLGEQPRRLWRHVERHRRRCDGRGEHGHGRRHLRVHFEPHWLRHLWLE